MSLTFLCYFSFSCVLGFELTGYTLSHSITFFVMGMFEIGLCELFALASFEL
jgi:hypothetical protein